MVWICYRFLTVIIEISYIYIHIYRVSQRLYKFVTSQFKKIILSISYKSKEVRFWWVPKLSTIFGNGNLGGLFQNFTCKPHQVTYQFKGLKNIR